MDKPNLPPSTAELWRRLQNDNLLAGAYLIGGTALALHLHHRISEDLDFFYAANKLPREPISRLVKQLEQEGYTIKRNDNPDVYDEFLIAGESLHDYQQNFYFNGTKVTFFADAGVTTAKLLTTPTSLHGPVTPTLRELFDAKAVVVMMRHRSRDWLDLYILMRDHGFTVSDFFAAYQKAGQAQYADSAWRSLAKLTASSSDPGYQALISPAPTLDEMSSFFASLPMHSACKK